MTTPYAAESAGRGWLVYMGHGADLAIMTPDEARETARLLIAAADTAEAAQPGQEG